MAVVGTTVAMCDGSGRYCSSHVRWQSLALALKALSLNETVGL